MPKHGEVGNYFYAADRKLWVGRITLPSTELDKTGKPKRRRKEMTAKSRSDLLAKMSAATKQLEKQGDLHTSSMTVAQWTDYWMREIVVKTRRPSTVASYRSIVAWIETAIGPVKLDKLTAAHIRKVFTIMSNPPDIDGVPQEPRSSTYQRNTHSVMSASFRDAEREGRIMRNPVDLVDAPLKNLTQLEAFTPTEAAKLLSAFEGQADLYLWATFLLTGARRGEVLGLEWDRVTDVLDLSWQMQRLPDGPRPANFEYRQISGGLYWTRPKTRAGWRIIPLVDPLKSVLERWKEEATANPWGLVFTRKTVAGETLPIDPDYATKLWPEVRKAAGISKSVRIHDLRHTTVDLLYAAGVPEDLITVIVGHSNRLMSRAYKSKADRDRLVAAMSQMSALLGYTQPEIEGVTG